MENFNLQLFSEETVITEEAITEETENTKFDGGKYGDPTKIEDFAVAGKDVILSVWSADGTTLLAIKGQKSLKLNRTADSIEITSKDTEGSWKAKIAGMKEWSIDTDGIAYLNDQSQKVLSTAFNESNPVLVKITNKKTKKDMFGGLAVITDFPLDMPFDDCMTYTLKLEGMGELTDLSDEV